MPKARRRKFLKIPFKPSKAERTYSQKNIVNINLGKMKTVGEMPSKSTIDTFSKKSSLRFQDSVREKLPTRTTSFLNKKVSSPGMDAEALMQKKHLTPQILSTLTGKEKLTKHKVIAQPPIRRVQSDTEETRHLSHAEKLQLLQTLLKEPSPFLDLHARFGVSKQTIRGLVKKGLLAEVWGPKAIGVKFRLTNKGKNYLKDLEVAARYESKMKERNLIRLKHRTSF